MWLYFDCSDVRRTRAVHLQHIWSCFMGNDVIVNSGESWNLNYFWFSPPLPPPPCWFLSRCLLPSERQARLEAVREVFLAAYSSTIGLKSAVSSPSGAISGLLEQFARGVGLRATNAIVWSVSACCHQSTVQCVRTIKCQTSVSTLVFRSSVWMFSWGTVWLKSEYSISCQFVQLPQCEDGSCVHIVFISHCFILESYRSPQNLRRLYRMCFSR